MNPFLLMNKKTRKTLLLLCQLIICQQAEQDRTTLTKKVQEIEASLTKKEELRLTAQLKLGRATELADDAQRFVASVWRK